MNLSEDDARLAERYRQLNQSENAGGVAVAGYMAIAGIGLVVSAIFFGGGDGGNPQFLLGVGACCTFGGGGYWLHARDIEKRRWKEQFSIEETFRRKGLSVYSNGQVSPLPKESRAQIAPRPL